MSSVYCIYRIVRCADTDLDCLWYYRFICLNICMGFPGVAAVKNPPANAGGIPGRITWSREWQPTPQYSCLENSIYSRAWWATVPGVTELDTTVHAHTRADTCK